MCKISVLMSIYNENDKEIYEAFTSILNQTFADFELIVVVDNPQITLFSEYLKELGISDKRIKIIYNDVNIGLAESMNKAFAISRGCYIARMDADDVAFPTRFWEEIQVLDREYDLVCSDYILIDENSKEINKKITSYSIETLELDLEYGNIIHHPTVMMTREIFEKSNGYRNFPCSQDYDLWLRIHEIGGRFAIINKPLLKYRIRANSITESKSFKQIATIWYIQKLHKERQMFGKDSYSLAQYDEYLTKLRLNDEQFIKECEAAKSYKKKIDDEKNQNKIKAVSMMIKLSIVNSFYRKLYIHNLREIIGMKMNRKKLGRG